MEMSPIRFDCPPFSSPDPATSGLLPLGDAATGGSSNAAPEEAVDPADKKAADWIDEVKSASSQDALDAVVQAYEDSGADYKTVADAIEAKQNEIDEG